MRKTILVSLIIATVSILSFIPTAHGQSRDELLAQIENKRAELKKLEAQFLSPSDEDREAFAEFLKQPNTGLVRVLPRESFDETPNKPGKLSLRGGGAYYSFVRLTHEYGYGSDIELSRGELSVGFAGADYGAIAMIGEMPLEEVTEQHPLATFLVSYQPPTEEAAARLEGRSFGSGGKTIDGLTYRRRLPAQVNGTYLLRSISYGDSDVLVALRVVRKDNDGSVIIAWKLLKKFPKPELTRSTASR